MNMFKNLLSKYFYKLRAIKIQEFRRFVSIGDLISERSENAKQLGFGEGSTCYDNVLVLGDVSVGKNTWIGPNVILDGSGILSIGDFVTISAGAQIYTHNSIQNNQSRGIESIARQSTQIGDGVYIGPNAIIEMGTTIGSNSIVGSLSLVRGNFPANSKIYGIPAKIIHD
jgi:acetyltransferase-like isoleucine patch superfamily enzyme